MIKQIKVIVGYECTVPVEQYGNVKPILTKEYILEGEGNLELEAKQVVDKAIDCIPCHSNKLYSLIKNPKPKIEEKRDVYKETAGHVLGHAQLSSSNSFANL